MPFDKAARARQLGGCVAHTGDAFFFAPSGCNVEWVANSAAETAPGTGKINMLIKTGRTRLTGPRAPFVDAGRMPEVGEILTDQSGARYLIAEIPPDPANPLITIIVTLPSAASPFFT